MNKLHFYRISAILFSLIILFSCSMAEDNPHEPPADSEAIILSGETLNDGFIIQNSDTIIFGFERITGLGVGNSEGNTEISITLPAGVSTFTITKDGALGWVDGITDTTGSFIVVTTSNPGSILIIDSGEAVGTALFVTTIDALTTIPLGSCDWQISPTANADILFARTIPDISINCPATVLSGTADFIINASETRISFEGTITPAPSITSYAWIQTAGPAVNLNGDDTATLSFNAPVVATDTDLTFQLTVTDDAGLTATETVTVTVLAP